MYTPLPTPGPHNHRPLSSCFFHQNSRILGTLFRLTVHIIFSCCFFFGTANCFPRVNPPFRSYVQRPTTRPPLESVAHRSVNGCRQGIGER
ncbi:hypothetical protein HanXRQr2_Chr14g0625881 [Helianthus annuus]|uniref:Uncharacterized protein n=1 Tax=Helianthus annuus TaxID=4232 RepID=A0A251S1A6_HELAN|nr:hypothetical protein HanXRQr2_Chr14g0625881 [Helianthus annuus]